jgi:hypothetical protein
LKIKFCACGWRINIWTFILDYLAFAIWYFCSVKGSQYISPIYIILSKIQLKISQEWNYTSALPLHKITRFMSYKYIMNPSSQRFTIFLFLAFSTYIFWVIFCLPLLQNLVFRPSFSFCNLVFMFCLCNCFSISSSLQFLQFGICIQFL